MVAKIGQLEKENKELRAYDREVDAFWERWSVELEKEAAGIDAELDRLREYCIENDLPPEEVFCDFEEDEENAVGCL